MSFNTGDDPSEVLSEINMTPLVDVMLVLLIVFIITMPMLTHAIKVDLPQETSAPRDIKPHTVEISVTLDGDILWNNEKVDDVVLEQRMRDTVTQHPEAELHVLADGEARYKHVAQVLSTATRNGLLNVGFVTRPDT